MRVTILRLTRMYRSASQLEIKFVFLGQEKYHTNHPIANKLETNCLPKRMRKTTSTNHQAYRDSRKNIDNVRQTSYQLRARLVQIIFRPSGEAQLQYYIIFGSFFCLKFVQQLSNNKNNPIVEKFCKILQQIFSNKFSKKVLRKDQLNQTGP